MVKSSKFKGTWRLLPRKWRYQLAMDSRADSVLVASFTLTIMQFIFQPLPLATHRERRLHPLAVSWSKG